MTKVIKVIALGSLLASSAAYAVSTAACAGCHGQHFEKAAMGKSKIVKNMSEADILVALKGYKNGTYGGAMKGLMKGQVAKLSDADMKAMAASIKGGAGVATDKATQHAAAAAVAQSKIIDINKNVCAPDRLNKEDLGNKKVITESTLGLRKANLYTEDKVIPEAEPDFNRPPPGQATKFERAYVNAPPMIPHSVEGLLPITKNNNQCLGCHMPDVAKSMGATPIPPSHFTNYRPTTVLKNGELVKEGKVVGLAKGDMGNVGDIKIAKAKKLNHLYQGRFNCTQCHAPQAKIDTAVGNTFQPDGLTGKFKSHSNLADEMNAGVK
jgi:cytochrome c-type protein NapB